MDARHGQVMKSLRHKTMSSAAAQEIRKRIVSGVYPPGHQLRQDGLAAELAMSRIPIREALFLLESEGFVKIIPHKGAIVASLSSNEIEELFNMRVILEPFLFERSAPHLSPQDLDELRLNLARYTESIEKLDANAWNELNTEFHTILYRHAASPRVESIVANLLVEYDRHTRIQLSMISGDRARAVQEHRHLLTLCEEGRYAEGADFMRQHIDHIRVGLVRLLNKNEAVRATTFTRPR